jgi:hypothetical protein
LIAGKSSSALSILLEGFPQHQENLRYHEELLNLCNSELPLDVDMMTFQIINTVGQERVQKVPGDLVGSIRKVLSLVAAKHLKEAFDLVPKQIRQLLDQGYRDPAPKQKASLDTLLDVFEVFSCTTTNIIDSIYEALSKTSKQKLNACAVMAIDQSEASCSLCEASGECPT